MNYAPYLRQWDIPDHLNRKTTMNETLHSPPWRRINQSGEKRVWLINAKIVGTIQTPRSLTLVHKKRTNIPSQSLLLHSL